MKKRAIWMLLLASVLGGPSCRIFKSKIAVYPIGLSFPVVEDAFMSFKGKIISPVRERGGLISIPPRTVSSGALTA